MVQGVLDASFSDALGEKRLGGVGCLIYRVGQMVLVTDGWDEEGFNSQILRELPVSPKLFSGREAKFKASAHSFLLEIMLPVTPGDNLVFPSRTWLR